MFCRGGNGQVSPLSESAPSAAEAILQGLQRRETEKKTASGNPTCAGRVAAPKRKRINLVRREQGGTNGAVPATLKFRKTAGVPIWGTPVSTRRKRDFAGISKADAKCEKLCRRQHAFYQTAIHRSGVWTARPSTYTLEIAESSVLPRTSIIRC